MWGRSVVVGAVTLVLAGCGCTGPAQQSGQTAEEPQATEEVDQTVEEATEETEEEPVEPLATERLGGEDRFETMAQVVAAGFDQSDWAVIVTGENFPDALSASSLAGAADGPVILTAQDRLSQDAEDELVRLQVKNAYIVGGESSVSADVEQTVSDLGISVVRVSGADRTETSVEAALATREADADSDTVVVCTGEGFADSLAMSPWCYQTASPILLARKGTLTDEEIAFVHDDADIKRVIIVGGDAAVSDEVMTQLGDYEYERLEGEDRYHTSAMVADWICQNGFSWATPALATGENFPDALAGSALMGTKACPILLVSDSSSVAKDVIKAHREEVESLIVLGGEATVSEELVASIAE